MWVCYARVCARRSSCAALTTSPIMRLRHPLPFALNISLFAALFDQRPPLTHRLNLRSQDQPPFFSHSDQIYGFSPETPQFRS